ncbi:MAG TPA: ComEC/Rec2 family competence protein [Candidatus Paceibacterota bacterium]|nr:ComEC/Rec2 family competence protein [Candidatus Paceibacterota bacterium]
MFIIFCISLVIGAILFRNFGFSIFEVSLCGALLGALFVLYFKSRKSLVLALAVFASVSLGAMRLWLVPVQDIEFGSRAFTGTVRSVDERLDRELLTIRVDQESFDIQATLYKQTNLSVGDRVAVRGNIEKAEDFVTETGRTFDYDGYLESKGVEAVMRNPQIKLLEEGKFSFVKMATNIRKSLAETLAHFVRFPVDGVVAGMLVGFQGGIPKYLSDIFRDTGTLHTLVLSGYNITVLVGFLGIVFRRMPFRLKTLAIGAGIFTLVLVSGAGVAAVRAGIMGGIALFAGMTLQSYQALRALFVSMLFFFFVNPQTIFVDPGLHLSFLATFFIITILPIIKNKFFFDEEGTKAWKKTLLETVILAVGLPIFMLPYLMYFSGLFPLFSPVANIVLVPIIPILMFGGLVVVATSFVPFLPNIFGAVISFVGMLSIKVLGFLALLPKWQTPPVGGWSVLLVYLFLFLIIFRKDIKLYFAHIRNIFTKTVNTRK